MEKSEIFKNAYYEVSGDFELVSFNDSIKEMCPNAKAGELCYKVLMNRDTPCLHCPICRNSETDNPIYFNTVFNTWMEETFTELPGGNIGVLTRMAEDTNNSLFNTLTPEENELIKKLTMGRAANDRLKDNSKRNSAIVYANKQMFYSMFILDLVEDKFTSVFSLGWVSEIIGKTVKASTTLERIVSQLVTAPSKPAMTVFTNIKTMSERIGRNTIIYQDYLGITGDWIRVSIVPIARDEEGRVTKVVYTSRNVGDEIKTHEKDALTGLYTRVAFSHYAREWLSKNPDVEVDVLVADIKNFKLVNSLYGEDKGDELLKYLATYIQSQFPGSICTRYGADQVACMYAASDRPERDWYEDMLLDFTNEAPVPNATLLAGIYRNVERPIGVIEMCDRALMALKSIKNSYGHTLAFYDGPFSKKRIKTQQYESKFMKAIRKREFKVWYQPKYNPYTNELAGAEALIRWEESKGKMIPPYEFIGIFEEDGLISVLDEYVFTTVCEQIEAWKKQGKKLVPISINLSRTSMHRLDIVDRYSKIAEDYGVDTALIPIEITESAATNNVEIKPLIDAFHEAGFILHMDDFGSEHSSLNGLTVLHLSVIKFDKSLIDGIGSESGELVLEYTMALSKKLGLNIVAEGVEDESQIEFLKKNSCDYIQGYFYSKPLPSEEFEAKMEII